MLRAAPLALDAIDWRAAAFATGPGDRVSIAEGVRAAYAAAGLTAPAQLAWVSSPLHGTIAAALVADPAARPKLLTPGLAAHVEVAERALAGCQPAGEDAARPQAAAGAPVRELVRTLPWEAARSAAHADLGPTEWSRVCARAGAGLSSQVSAIVTCIRRGIREVAGAGAESLLRMAALDAVLGQHDAPWLAQFSAMGRLRGLEGLAAVAADAGWWWPYENLVIVCDRPSELHRDETGRLHRSDGPALRFGGGFELHAWGGTPVPADFIGSLGSLSSGQITREENAELRRVMLEYYGFDRYLNDTGATPVSRDETGVLWRIDMPGDEPVAMVEVQNATQEPDGTSRTYWLRVPPFLQTAREGVAWTFGLTAEEYLPVKQT